MLRTGLVALGTEVDRLVTGQDPDPVSAVEVLQGELEAWQGALASLSSSVTSRLDQSRSERETLLGAFDGRLRRELEARGRTVHGEMGLLIVDGLVHVETDLKKVSVRVNGAAAPVKTPNAVADVVDAALAELVEKITPPETMLELVLTAYERELHSTGKEVGTHIPTTAILGHLAFARQTAAFRANPTSANFRPYAREAFRADLYTLLASGKLTSRGMRLCHAAGTDTSGAVHMLVPSIGRPAHVGRLWFEAGRGDA